MLHSIAQDHLHAQTLPQIDVHDLHETRIDRLVAQRVWAAERWVWCECVALTRSCDLPSLISSMIRSAEVNRTVDLLRRLLPCATACWCEPDLDVDDVDCAGWKRDLEPDGRVFPAA